MTVRLTTASEVPFLLSSSTLITPQIFGAISPRGHVTAPRRIEPLKLLSTVVKYSTFRRRENILRSSNVSNIVNFCFFLACENLPTPHPHPYPPPAPVFSRRQNFRFECFTRLNSPNVSCQHEILSCRSRPAREWQMHDSVYTRRW